MKYQPGDDIIVLHSNEEGKVIEIMNDKMVMIEVRGVKFPAYMNQIDFPYFHRFTKNKIIPENNKQLKKELPKKYIDTVAKEKQTPNKIQVNNGVWLSLIPKFAMDEFGDEIVDALKLYLVNKTDKGYRFIYTQEFNGRVNFELNNQVTAYHDFYLHDILFSELNDSPAFYFEFSLITPDKTKADYFETSLKPSPKKVFKRIEEIKNKNEPSFAFELFNEFPRKAEEEKIEFSSTINEKFKIYNAKKIKENLEPARTVVDLHIEKLVNDFSRMSNFEILSLQLKQFEKYFELAVMHHLPSLIIIHGVGTGKLRDEIHEILKTKKQVRYFINQYDPRFGYGATEIFL